MKIYVDKLPERCGDCDIVHEEVIDRFENMEELLHHACPLLGLSINPEKRDIGCPLIELKPKELVWSIEDSKYYVANISDIVSISFTWSPCYCNSIKVNERLIMNYFDKTEKELMDICNEIKNKIFNEMIGG